MQIGFIDTVQSLATSTPMQQDQQVSHWALFLGTTFALLLLFFIVVALISVVRSARRRAQKGRTDRPEPLDAWAEAGKRTAAPPRHDGEE